MKLCLPVIPYIQLIYNITISVETIQCSTLVFVILNWPLSSLGNVWDVILDAVITDKYDLDCLEKLVLSYRTEKKVSFLIKLCIGHYGRNVRSDLFILSTFILLHIWLVPVSSFYKFTYPCFL